MLHTIIFPVPRYRKNLPEFISMETPIKMKLDCPIPNLDMEMVTLGHGSGGLLTNQLLDAGVFSMLSNEFLDQRGDGAILNLEGRTAFTTDSFVVSPIFFPGGNIGDLAVNGTVNDLVMCGAIPRYLSLSFILEEGLPIKELWEIIHSIGIAASTAKVEVVTGDTKVVDRGAMDRDFDALGKRPKSQAFPGNESMTVAWCQRLAGFGTLWS